MAQVESYKGPSIHIQILVLDIQRPDFGQNYEIAAVKTFKRLNLGFQTV